MRKVFVQHNCIINGTPVEPIVCNASDSAQFEHGKTFHDEAFVQLANAFISADHTYFLTDKTDEELLVDFV